MRDDCSAPSGQLVQRVQRFLGQWTRERVSFGALDGLLDQRLLGAEVAEDRDFIYRRCVGDAAGGGAAEAVLREHLHGCVENGCSSVHGVGTYPAPHMHASGYLLTSNVSRIRMAAARPAWGRGVEVLWAAPHSRSAKRDRPHHRSPESTFGRQCPADS